MCSTRCLSSLVVFESPYYTFPNFVFVTPSSSVLHLFSMFSFVLFLLFSYRLSVINMSVIYLFVWTPLQVYWSREQYDTLEVLIIIWYKIKRHSGPVDVLRRTSRYQKVHKKIVKDRGVHWIHTRHGTVHFLGFIVP